MINVFNTNNFIKKNQQSTSPGQDVKMYRSSEQLEN